MGVISKSLKNVYTFNPSTVSDRNNLILPLSKLCCPNWSETLCITERFYTIIERDKYDIH